MRVAIVLGIVSALAAPAFTQVNNLQVIMATYVTRSKDRAGAPVETTETGIHYFVPDGRYRVDRQRPNEVGTFEIIDSNRVRWSGNTNGDVARVRQPRTINRDALENFLSSPHKLAEGSQHSIRLGPNQEYLGTRQVGELTLEGIKQTFDVDIPGEEPTTFETWKYFPQSPECIYTGPEEFLLCAAQHRPPVTMEYSGTMGGGSLVEMKLVDVKSELVSGDLFDPDRWRGRRQP